MNTNKPYKAAAPQETVIRIKNIIQRTGMPVREQILGDDNMFFSCRVSITNDDDFSIGTNGKGMNNEYALASGYAEFMERLQNRVIVYPNPASVGSPYRFFPDEMDYEWSSREEIIKYVKKYTPAALPEEGITANTLKGRQISFLHLNTKEVKQVPYSLIRWVNGSNGMSSGNILEESLIQGFCEIFERFALQQMYLRSIVPPNVPISTFQGMEILSWLEKVRLEYGLEYEIKDLSLGKGFPVLGLLVYSSDRSKYILQLGADLNPEVALQRCFTEIFQGYTATTLSFENNVNTCEKFDLFNEFKRSLTYGRGRLPQSFFCCEPSYEYRGHTSIAIGKTFREDLSNICQWIMNKGYDIYIRDNSFLGFPTTHIVIPGMSDIDYHFCRLNRRILHMDLTENQKNPLFSLRHLTTETYMKTIEYIESLDSVGVDLFTRSTNPNNHVNRHLLLMVLYIRMNDKDKAIHYQQVYNKEHRGGRIITDELLDKLMEYPYRIFDTILVPDCFNCESCQIKKGCRYPLLRKVEDSIQRAMIAFDFDQRHLLNLFYQ